MNKQAIIDRLYCTDEEYKSMQNGLEKILLKGSDGFTEGLWVYPLEPSDKSGTKFRFVFHNDPIMFSGSPRAIAGLVGIATSKGPTQRAVAASDDCIALFKKAGKEAIDYFHNSIKTKKVQTK